MHGEAFIVLPVNTHEVKKHVMCGAYTTYALVVIPGGQETSAMLYLHVGPEFPACTLNGCTSLQLQYLHSFTAAVHWI